MDALITSFQFEFFRNGTLAAVMVGALCGLIGVCIVLRGMSYIGHGLSHAVFGGAVVAFVVNWNFYAGQTCPDQSLYPADSAPNLVRRINTALQRADQIHHMEGRDNIHWYAPIVADAEAGFGGSLNAYELMQAMIESGAGGVYFEDQLASAKKCGHMGGKVMVPTQEFITKLVTARLAADVMGIPTVLLARTNANSAKLLTSDSQTGMASFSQLQEREFELEQQFGFEAVKHQSFVGAGYFDQLQTTISGGYTSTIALNC